MNNLKRVSLTSRTIFWIILIAFITMILFAFFNSQLGQTALLVCCGGGVVLVIVGLLSERGMRRPQ